MEMDVDGHNVLVEDEDWSGDDTPRMTEREAFAALSEEGSLTRAQLNRITGAVWDGNNHVEYVPDRSQAYCHEPDVDEYPWGTVTYEYQENYPNQGWLLIVGTTLNEGWVELGWHDPGGYNQASDSGLTRDEFEDLWQDYRHLVGLESFEDEPNEARELFCRAEDWERILAESVRGDDEA